MFEGHNSIVLCKAAVMKMMEEYMNKSIYTPENYICVTNVDFDNVKCSATFHLEPKKKMEEQ